MWTLYEFTDEVDDIIGYFKTKKDAEEAKNFWYRNGFKKPKSRLEIHATTLWESSNEFEKFWRKDK